jgi:hypothetical protein
MPKFDPIPLLQRAFAPDGWLAKLWPLWSLFLVCLLVVLFLNPAKAGLIVYGISKPLLGGLLGLMVHWGVKQILPPPDPSSGIADGLDRKCATWIVCACILTMGFLP